MESCAKNCIALQSKTDGDIADPKGLHYINLEGLWETTSHHPIALKFFLVCFLMEPPKMGGCAM